MVSSKRFNSIFAPDRQKVIHDVLDFDGDGSVGL